MIALAPTTRIFVYTEATDMRKSFNGLSGLVKEHFQVDLFSGHLFVFFNRRRDYVKILMWDCDGLALWSKAHEPEHPRFKVFTKVARTNSFSVFATSACDMDRKDLSRRTRRNEMPAKQKRGTARPPQQPGGRKQHCV
ncbi:IS66 family insertion sequence element accessory protein TnpB [Planctomycetes bacterium TBK1r]|uniref:IS66 Orf2 like protein n=1 Tax=Stieleria magnilauensis TaxID=2527963 RepID=A0ABX5XJM7_9BACT|nr:IS66 Orf2 like protein [Planctomycetes bacterium TBK1r]QDV83200.1 IS66 Orf2 like protein [Planctomycetes bacterium TBK1r]QDV85739.1 IS66 Orf2 like protein [Planctomycetes bacterium TBK1r]